MEKKKGKGIGKFVAGAALGAGLGILFAPKSGKETREEIGKKLQELKNHAKEIKLDNVREKITAKIADIEEDLRELDKEKVLKAAKQKAQKIEKKAADLYELAKEKGTPILEKTAKELKETTAGALQKIVDKLEKEK